MRKNMKSNKLMKCIMVLLVFAMTLAGSIVLPGKAADATFATSQVLDATLDVALCDGTNPNGVESLGVKFGNMHQAKGNEIGLPLPFEKDALVDFALSEIEKLDKENEARRNRVSKTRKENEPLLAEIYSRFTDDEILTSDSFSDMELTTQKIVALLTTLVKEEKIVKVDKVKVDKRKLQGYKLC